MTVLAFLLVIGPLIFIHELGHYFAGRAFGVKAETFSIGFGRAIGGWVDRRGTHWKIGWLPLGGYVKFAGDANAASQPSKEWLAMSPEQRAETFQAKPLWQRFIIVAAGPLTNFLFAVVVFMGVFATYGVPTTPPVIERVIAGSPAERAGMRPGDRIVEIEGRAIETYADLQHVVRFRPGREMEFAIDRDGRIVEIPARIGAHVERDSFGNEARIGMLGVESGAVEGRRLAIYEVPGAAVAKTGDIVEIMVVTLGQIVAGDRSVKELGGPLKIAQYSGQQASLGWFEFVLFMTLISINLGFINLLPIPLLDGGHLLLYLIEGVRRRPLSQETLEWAYRTGLVALLGFMLFVTINDLASFGLLSRIGGLIG
ncbi:MAG: RIP metalloprotease RseP [Sphingomonadaceae bacterium]